MDGVLKFISDALNGTYKSKGPKGPLIHWVLLILFFAYWLFSFAFSYPARHFILIAVLAVLAAYTQGLNRSLYCQIHIK